MKKYAETLITIILTFFVSLLLNGTIAYFAQPNGTIKIGSAITANTLNYLIIDIENNDSKPVDGIVLSLPSTTVITEIVSSHPVNIQDIPAVVGGNQIKYIKISNIEPSTTVELLIPIVDQSVTNLIRVINSKEIKFSVLDKKTVTPLLQLAIQSSLTTAVIYALIYGIFAFWSFANSEKLKAEFEKDNDALKKNMKDTTDVMHNKMDTLNTRMNETINTNHRIRLVLLARLSDYQKELDFWRDTIRKILYEGKTDKRAEELFNQVTKSLKTYSVQKRDVDFDAINTLAIMLTKDDNDK